MPSTPTNAGIITDEGGERHIPSSTRADGTTRKAIKIRPGYRPPEDVEVYKNRTAEGFRERTRRLGVIPGAVTDDPGPDTSSSSASNKNAKRREARKKAKGNGEETGGKSKDGAAPPAEPPAEEVDPAAEREKKARNLKKKLKQARELQTKKDVGEALLPEQIAKVIKISELIRELEALGFDAEGEPKQSTADGAGAKAGSEK